MTTPVDFSTAKLLKEKGFDYHSLYNDFADYYDYYDPKVQGRLHESDFSEDKFPDADKWTPVPYTYQVVMWLYEKYGIWIVVNPHKGEDDLGKPFMEFDPEVWSFTNECILHNTNLLYFNSPTKAYEAAIQYTLNNLI